jgi:hypothetical protein
LRHRLLRLRMRGLLRLWRRLLRLWLLWRRLLRLWLLWLWLLYCLLRFEWRLRRSGRLLLPLPGRPRRLSGRWSRGRACRHSWLRRRPLLGRLLR